MKKFLKNTIKYIAIISQNHILSLFNREIKYGREKE